MLQVQREWLYPKCREYDGKYSWRSKTTSKRSSLGPANNRTYHLWTQHIFYVSRTTSMMMMVLWLEAALPFRSWSRSSLHETRQYPCGNEWIGSGGNTYPDLPMLMISTVGGILRRTQEGAEELRYGRISRKMDGDAVEGTLVVHGDGNKHTRCLRRSGSALPKGLARWQSTK